MNKGLEKVIIESNSPAENLAALYFLSAKTGKPICETAKNYANKGFMDFPYCRVSDSTDVVAGYSDKSYRVETEYVINFSDLPKFDEFVEKLNNPELKVVLNKDYTAIVTPTEIRVGCQVFPISIIRDLQKAVDSVTK